MAQHRPIGLQAVEARIVEETCIRYGGAVMVCTIRLDNGYVVRGQSSPTDPRRFDEAIGAKLARQRAIAKIIPLLEFLDAETRYRQRQALDEPDPWCSAQRATDSPASYYSNRLQPV
jgi:hypothetical protein